MLAKSQRADELPRKEVRACQPCHSGTSPYQPEASSPVFSPDCVAGSETIAFEPITRKRTKARTLQMINLSASYCFELRAANGWSVLLGVPL